jgi:cold shock CspA family protein
MSAGADLSLTRARALVLITATEEDLRRYITEWVIPHSDDPHAVFGVLASSLEQRAIKDRADASDPYVWVDYLDYADTYQILNQNSSLLPGEVSDSLRALTPRLEIVTRVRNRLAHSRRFDVDDLDAVEQLSAAALNSPLRMPRLKAAADRMATDPTWNSHEDSWAPSAASMPNNVPPPEFEETGLIGRQRESAELLAALRKRHKHVITLVGEGGVGKTALAVQCLSVLVEDPDAEYAAVVWVSLKQHRLTPSGIELISGASTDLPEVIRAIAVVFEMPTDATMPEVMEAVQGLPVLIALDNAEAVDGDDVLDLIDQFPRDTDFLLTSRVGLGQLESRMQVGPLDIKAGIAMYRQFANRRGQVHLARAPQDTCEDIVRSLACRPLAIRWFIEAVAAGREPADVLAQQELLIDYCVETVYEGLDDVSRRTAIALLVADRPLPIGEIVALAELTRDDVHRGLHDLDRRSLVTKDLSGQGLEQVYELSALAGDFLRRTSSEDGVRELITDRWVRMLKSDEARRTETRRGLTPSALRVNSGEERVAADLLHRALRASKNGDQHLARTLCDQAKEVAPGYFEVPRVGGFIAASADRPEEALRQYQHALELAQTEDDEAVVNYWMADVLARSLHDVEAGVGHARRAHEVLDLPDTALRLGRVLMWEERFDEAEGFLRDALERAGSGRTRAIARTNLVNLSRRKVEARSFDGRDPIGAVRMGALGLREVIESEGLQLADRRMHSAVLDLFRQTAGSVYVVNVPGEVDDAVLDIIRQISLWIPHAEPHGLAPDVDQQLSRMLDSTSLGEEVRTSITGLMNRDGLGDASAAREARLRGTVSTYLGEKGYGFITPHSADDRLYFHRTALDEGIVGAIFLRREQPVTFRVGEWQGRPCAIEVRVEATPEERSGLLNNRPGRVARVDSHNVLVEDRETLVLVFCNQSAMADGLALGDLSVGDEVIFSSVVGENRLRATPYSVCRPDDEVEPVSTADAQPSRG